MINLENYLNDSGSYASNTNMRMIDTPFPDGSMFRVRLHCIDSEYCPADCRDGCITAAKSGLRSLCLAVEICYGPHSGMGFYDQITLPEEFQKINLTDGQKKACKHGARLLAQLLAGSGCVLQVQNWRSFDGLEACVEVSVNSYNNTSKQRILKGLLPSDPNISQIQQKGEIIAEPKQTSQTASWDAKATPAPNAQQTAQMVQNVFGGSPQIMQNPTNSWVRSQEDDKIPF